MPEAVKNFETGAQRSTDKDQVRFDLISPTALTRLAAVYRNGAEKYGEHNWEKGMDIAEILNHVIAHIYNYLDGRVSLEDDLAHAAWGLFAAMHMEDRMPHLNHHLRPNHSVTIKQQSGD